MVVKLNTVRLNGASLNQASLNGVGERLRASAGGGGGEVIPPEEPDVPDVPVTYTLNASVENGSVKATVNGVAVTLPYTANEGDVVVVEVTANDGYEFEGWSDGSTDNPRSITMTADVALSAQCVEVVAPPVGNYIQFEDPAVEAVLIAKGVSSDGVGITMADAQAVTSNMQAWFNNNASVISFNELQYFTGITQLGLFGVNATYAGAFYKCTALTEVTIPANVTLIGEYCFCDSSSLANVTFADSSKITYIGIGAFKNTKIAGEISFPNVETIKGAAFANTNITKVLSLGKITIIEGIPSGYASALFDGCASLTFIELPSTLTDIVGYAIGRCAALTTIVCRATTPPNLSAQAFYGCNALTSIYVPDAALEAYKTATNWSQFSDRIKPLSEHVEE